jgi:hypothetical protein
MLPFRSSDDVIERKYKVMVQESSSNHKFLWTAKNISAMFYFYHNEMDGEEDSFVSTNTEAKDNLLNRQGCHLPHIFALLKKGRRREP